MGYRMTYITNT